MEKKQSGGFSGSLGFVFAAAGSAVGVGNIWRFPYLAAQDGGIVGLVFFVMVAFAALTSCVSVMETLVAGAMELFGAERRKVSLIIAVLSAVLICLGYNVLYFELPLPNGQVGQLLDVMDYISNSFLMPLISLLTCVFIGWIVKPSWIAGEMELGGCRFGRKKLYGIMIRYIAPLIMAVLFVQSMGLLS